MTFSLLATLCLLASSSAAQNITNQAQLNGALSALSSRTGEAYFAGYASLLKSIVPSAAPTTSPDAASRIASAYAASSSSPFATAANLFLAGVAGAGEIFIQDYTDAQYGPCLLNNTNTRQPATSVYPKKSAKDAPYDISETQLRSDIYIPPDFTYGKKPPVLFIPGTGVEACNNYLPNYGKEWANGSVAYADPVYVNIPGNMNNDIQDNAEYIAYAINYISGISGNRNVSLLTWSQGSVAAQWALKYWPSTRNITSDVINISGDYHGTVLAPLICPGTGTSPGFPCPPAIYQQFYNSNFVKTLRANGGDSAYVPTTAIWTIYDEIVEPQQSPNASAMLNDARGVGVLNVQLQTLCTPFSVAASPNFGHEATLYNAVGFALAKDALMYPGPANIARSGAVSQCQTFEAPGLNLQDVFNTEATIPEAAFTIATYEPKVLQEPPIKAYAAADTPTN